MSQLSLVLSFSFGFTSSLVLASALQRRKISTWWLKLTTKPMTISADSHGQMNVSVHDGDSVSMVSKQINIFEEIYKIGFSSFLKTEDFRKDERITLTNSSSQLKYISSNIQTK